MERLKFIVDMLFYACVLLIILFRLCALFTVMTAFVVLMWITLFIKVGITIYEIRKGDDSDVHS